tara:strand:+ start:264 stop:1433 length:1170 start_codon:yes stop_codon:yes gene_type:complete
LNKYGIYLIGISVTFCYSSYAYLFSALLQTWETELNISRNKLTFAYSLGLMIHGLLLPYLGKLVDRNYSFIMMWLSPLLLGFSVINLAFVNTYYEFIIAWVLVSATAGGCLYTMIFSVLTINLKKDIKNSIAIITLIAGLASTYTYPTATYLTESFNWRTTVLIFGIVNILISAPANYFGFKTIIHQEKNFNSNTKAEKQENIYYNPKFWLLCFPLFVFGFNAGAIITHIIPMMQEKNLSLTMAVLIASLFGPGQIIGRILIMTYGRNKSNIGLFVLCFYSSLIGIIFLYFVNFSFYLAFLFILFNSAAFGSMAILKPLVQNDIFGKMNFGNIHGILAICFMSGSIAGPWIGSLIWSFGGYNLLIILFFILAIFGNISALILKNYKTKV